MTQPKLTLRGFDPKDAPIVRKRCAWRKGSIQPYSSLWITVLRFALLNRPKLNSLNEDLQGSEAARRRRAIYFDSHHPWPLHGTIDVRNFADMLGEPLESFRWSSIGDFPIGFWSLFSGTHVCMECMAQGYHTVIFSATCIDRCPRHGAPLLNRWACHAPDLGSRPYMSLG